MRKLTPRHNQGFSLMQTSVILAAAGVALTAALPGGEISGEARKEAITKQRMHAIEKATQKFMATNFRRPCPASGVLPVTDEGFGTEHTTPGTCTGAEMKVDNIVIGIPPVRALGLPDEYALDGYGRRITYTVDLDATQAESCRDMQSQGTKGTVRVFRESTETTPTDRIMWALTSHGKDGHGAYPAGGSATLSRINTFTQNADTHANANVKADFSAGIANTQILPKQSNNFDDYLWYNESTKNKCCTGLLCNQGFGMTIEATDLADLVHTELTYAIGDINGDGIDDIAYANYEDTDGEVKVILGSKTGWPVATTSETGIGNATYTIHMNSWGSGQGVAIAVGDATEDGKADILVNGNAYAYFIYDLDAAGPGSHDVTDLITDDHALRLYHGGSNPIGGPVAFGDLDGDGTKDLLITPGETHYAIFVMYGQDMTAWNAIGDEQHLGLLNGTTGFLLYDPSETHWVGPNKALTTGDINNDGYDDIIAGYLLNPEGGTTGGVYYIAGRAQASWGVGGPPLPFFDVSATGTGDPQSGVITRGAFFHVEGGEILLGQSVTVADINNDEYDDILMVGNFSVFGVFGQNTNWGTVGNNDLNSMADFKIDFFTNQPAGAANLTSYAGFSYFNTVAVADINGDAMNDILLSCYHTTQSNANSGTTYVLFAPNTANGWASNTWAASSPVTMFTATGSGWDNFDGTKGFLIEGAAGDFSGNARVLDFNKDGLNDILLGATEHGDSDIGALYMIWGRDKTPWRTRYDSTVKTLPKIDATDLAN